MAGDWLKVEHTLPDKPEVVVMAATLALDQDAVAGKLLRVWAWADQNTVNGSDITVTSSFLDRLTICPGFAAAMRKVGWLEGRDCALHFPNFDRHNGQTAKARAETNRRVSKFRASPENRDSNRVSNGNVTENALQKPLPEKRREEKRSDQPPEDLPLPRENAPASPPLGGGKDSLPTSEEAIAVANLFGRKHGTRWSPREVAKFKECRKREVLTLDSMRLIADYYAAERAKGDDGRHRRDLATFLNNFDGELDRAKATKPKNGKALEWAPAPNIVPMLSPEEDERIRREAKSLAAGLKANLARTEA